VLIPTYAAGQRSLQDACMHGHLDGVHGWSPGDQTGEPSQPTHQHNRGERDAEHGDRQVQGNPNHVGLHLRRVEDPLVRYQPQRKGVCSWLAVCRGVAVRDRVCCSVLGGVVWCVAADVRSACISMMKDSLQVCCHRKARGQGGVCSVQCKARHSSFQLLSAFELFTGDRSLHVHFVEVCSTRLHARCFC
jgi:hypothetical protein